MKRFAYGDDLRGYEFLDVAKGRPPKKHNGLPLSHEVHAPPPPGGIHAIVNGMKQIHRAVNEGDLKYQEHEFKRPRAKLGGQSYEDLVRSGEAKTYGCSRWI